MASGYMKKIETARDSLRYAFVWSPAANALEFPLYPECWQQLELAPFRSIYPDSDFEDIHRDDDLD